MQFVCKNCFCDKEIVGFIISQGNLGNCNYCNSNNIEIIEFEEAGHYPMIECPVLFASKIEFWAK